MDTEIKDRVKTAQHHIKQGGYAQPQGGMMYQQPGQQQPLHQPQPGYPGPKY